MRLGPLIIDVQGYGLEPHEREMLQHPWVGGLILFTRNFESRSQLRALTAEIKAARPDILISVDHEGGRVQRFREGFTALPSFLELGSGLLDSQGRVCPSALAIAVQNARAAGAVLAQELLEVGVGFSYTPVLDLEFGRSAVLHQRALSPDPGLVSILAGAVIQGLQQRGFQSCGKHFPGHGYASADSHEALPVDDRSLDEILALDLVPYMRLGQGPWGHPPLSAVMPAHVLYPKIDPDWPAGFSRVWIQRVLRERIQFDGVVISDDLSMAGAAVVPNVVDRAVAAFEAGCDATLVCNRPELAQQLLDGLPGRLPGLLAAPERRGLERLRPRRADGLA
jgi:beta-N-acetylhexosaminidase